MLKLHGFSQSGNTFKVAFLLRALGVPWQPVPIGFAEFAGGATRDPAWRDRVTRWVRCRSSRTRAAASSRSRA